ncbi:MAG TPA: hypothetical protein VG734_23645 [Lacunisphaera sp.]|nr:hypothetical protein [Lacunisphaera sp.]
MRFFHHLERTFGRFAIPNLALYLIGGQIMFFSLALMAQFDVRKILFAPALVLQGEVWRMFTFVFVPPVTGRLSMTGAVFLALTWYFFYIISQALENYWGVFRFNLFFLVGWALTVAVAFVTPTEVADYAFFAVSVFLAFAFLNPDFEIYLFFILPVKIKWLALVMWLGFAWVFIRGDWADRLGVLAATGNFLLFFTSEIIQRIKTGRRHMHQQVRRATFQQSEGEPRHRCVVCGKNDITHPQEDFRYGDDDRCYCAEHRPKKT